MLFRSNDTATTEIYTLSLHDALPIFRLALERAGTPIGANDLFIAAHAVALDAILVTANEREFSRVPGLKVENWAA